MDDPRQSPEAVERRHLLGLDSMHARTVEQIRTLHLVEGTKKCFCPDVNRWFASRAEFEAQIGGILASLPPASVPPLAPDDVWRKVAKFPFRGQIALSVKRKDGFPILAAICEGDL